MGKLVRSKTNPYSLPTWKPPIAFNCLKGVKSAKNLILSACINPIVHPDMYKYIFSEMGLFLDAPGATNSFESRFCTEHSATLRCEF